MHHTRRTPFPMLDRFIGRHPHCWSAISKDISPLVEIQNLPDACGAVHKERSNPPKRIFLSRIK